MQRYFGNIIGKEAVLAESDQFHLIKVMRARVNDQIEVVCEGKLFLCSVESIKPLSIKIITRLKENNELKNDVVLIASLLKGEKLDLVLQKATELGVEEIVLLQSERSIAKIRNLDRSFKLERFNRIVKEAAEQSKRTRLPLLYRVIKFDQLPEIRADIKLMAYEGEKGSTSSFLNAVKSVKSGERIAIMIGPEGGFSENEVNEAKEYGYKTVSLGKRILRAETASFYALSVLAAHLERK
ncbi:MAG: 16S rRNA (uracil(1498)-N(3))-methyltransferase [Bacilli bacterium]|nr:16S rRNA (uracil(1498)-N(3))-methyltransferase [Bacilli bacterium]